MKICRSCIKEIDDAASKCPYCQSFQIWYKNPQIYAVIFPLAIFLVTLYALGLLFDKDYVGNEDLFEVTEISHTRGEYGELAVNYLVENNSDTQWQNITYQVLVFDSAGELLFVDTGQDYGWLVQPNQSSHLTVELGNTLNADTWELKILGMESVRF